MDRILQSQAGTLRATWEVDGAAVDPGTVTVTIIRDSDGSTLVSGAATDGGGSDRTYTLNHAQTAILDNLRAVWSAQDGSSLTTYAEVVGGFHFSVQRARLTSPLQDSAYSNEAILFYRTLAEMAIEDVCGVCFVPRYRRDQAQICSWGTLSVSRSKLRAVRQITTNYNGADQPLPTLAGVQIINTSQIFMPIAWNWWSLPIKVAYESGYDFVPPRVGRATLALARRWLVESPWDERLTAFRTREGGEMSILTASHTEPFDIPEVVAVADLYGAPMIA